MKKSLHAGLLCSAFALTWGLSTADAQEVSAVEAENGNLWFVELAGKPTADGASLKNVRAEKAAFKVLAAAEGATYKLRRSYDVLFNGFSVEVTPSERMKLGSLPGVKAMWPVEVLALPELENGSGSKINLDTAIAMTGSDIAQNTLGFTGAGVRVAVMDTGIDYDNADLGGDNVARNNSDQFPNGRVVAGFDFVGDAFNGGNAQVPDAFPDDCNGHGSHVAGIVGANGELIGVAPDVVFGAYRVFGCDGSTTADIMLAAMERALADGMQVLNMSIGSRAQWPQYPTGAAATRLIKKGMVVVASAGNNGPGGGAPDGLYAGGAPGVGTDVIGVASFDNTHTKKLSFIVNPGGTSYGYNQAAASPIAPVSGTSGTGIITSIGTPATLNSGCDAGQFAGFPAGNIALIRRGTCGFNQKSNNAQVAGASAVILFNNVAGELNPTVVGPPQINIPVVAVTAADGAAIFTTATTTPPATLTWTDVFISIPLASGGLISGFSSFGLAPDLSFKPDIGAPGGSIFSTIPLALGGHGLNSGTSMSSPHVAGAVALLLQAEPGIAPSAVRGRLQNSADPKNWSGNPGLGFLDHAYRQGAGMLDIDDAILATVDVTPSKLGVGESQAGPQTRTLTVRNRGGSSVTFDLSHVAGLASGPNNLNGASFAPTGTFNAPAGVVFSAPNVTVPAGGSAAFNVTITANAALPAQSLYGGYVVLTPQGGGQAYRVPYGGFVGDYQSLPVLVPTPNGFPWLARLNAAGTTFTNQPAGGTFTMVGNDSPNFLVHLHHQSRYYEFRVTDQATGALIHPTFYNFDEGDFVPRNTTPGGFFAFTWDGTRAHDNGDGSGDHRKFVPDGTYIVTLRVLKALGNANNPAHWETWVSPPVTIDRP